MIGEEQLGQIRGQLVELDADIDRVALAIEYEASCTIPDGEQLGFLYEKIDRLHSARQRVNDIFERFTTGELEPSCDLTAEISLAIASDWQVPGWHDWWKKLEMALRRCIGQFFKAAAKIYQRWNQVVKQAYSGFRKLWQKLLSGRTGTERAKKRPAALPLAPVPLALEQAPGALSGAIRGEVRYMRRFL